MITKKNQKALEIKWKTIKRIQLQKNDRYYRISNYNVSFSLI